MSVAARVDVPVVPDTKGFRETVEAYLKKLEKGISLAIGLEVDDKAIASKVRESKQKAQEEADRSPVTVPVKPTSSLDKAWKNKVRSQIYAASKDLTLNIPATPETEDMRRDLEQAIQAAEAGLAAGIPVDPEKGAEFKARIDEMIAEIEQKNASIKATINADADTGKAEAQLDAAARNRKSTVNLTIAQAPLKKAQQALANLSGGRAVTNLSKDLGNAFVNLDESLPKIAGISLAVAGIGSAAFASLSGVASLAAALTQLAGLAALIPAGLGSLAAVGGTLFAAFKGVGAALSASGKATAATGSASKSAAAAAQDLTQKQEALASAQHQVGEAAYEVQQAEAGVASATRQVAQAQRAAQQAQQALNDARAQAVKDLRDLNDTLADAQLSERSAAFALTDAQNAYKQGIRTNASQQQLAKLQLALDQATQAYKESQQAVSDAAAAKSKADAKGVAGSDGVVQAQQSIADAAQNVKDAQAQAADAAHQQTEAEYNLAQAHQQVTDATIALQQAQVTAGAGGAAAAGAADQFAAAMAKLPPNAQAAVKAILAVKDQLSGLQKVIQQNFFEGFAAGLGALSASLIPQLQTGLSGVATQLGSLTNGLMAQLQQSLGGGILQTMLASLAASIQASQPGLMAMTKAFVTVGQIGATFLPGIAKSISDISLRFNDWIQAAASSGDLANWIQGSLTALSQLGSILGSIGHIVAGLFSAMNATGVGTLAALSAGLKTVASVIDSPAFQQTLQTIFSGAAAGASGLMTALAPLGRMFEALAPQISLVLTSSGQVLGSLLSQISGALSSPVFASGLTGFFAGIESGLQAIGPALPAVAQGIGALASFAGQLGASLGPVLGQAFQTLAPLVGALTTALEPLLPMLGQTLVAAIQAITPILLQLATTAIPPLVGLVQQLLPVVVQIVQALGPALLPIATQLGQTLAALAPIFAQLAITAIPPLLGVIKALLPFVTLMLQQLGPELTPVIQTAAALISALAPILAAVAQGLMPIVKALLPVLISLVQAMMPLFKNLSPVISAVGSVLTAVLVPAIKIISSVLSGLITFITGAFTGNWSKAWSGLVSIVTGVWDTIGPAVKKALNGVIDAVNGAIRGINSISSKVGIPKIPDIPHLAIGADIMPTNGGTLALLGEGGKAETVTNLGATNQMIQNANKLAGLALAGGSASRAGDTFNITEVSDPVGTAMAVSRRQQMAGA